MKAKIYLIAGLPGTTPEKEVEALLDLMCRIERTVSIREISLSIAPFVPKPLTPFADHPFMDKKSYKKYRTLMAKGLSRLKVRISTDFFSYSESELDYKTGILKGDEFIKFIMENSPQG